MLIEVDDNVEVYYDEQKLNKNTGNNNYNYEITTDQLITGTKYIYLKEGRRGSKEKMEDMKIDLYDEYIIESIQGSLKEGKNSQKLNVNFSNAISSISNNFLLIK